MLYKGEDIAKHMDVDLVQREAVFRPAHLFVRPAQLGMDEDSVLNEGKD